MIRFLAVLGATLLIAACSDDSGGPAAEACPTDAVPGQTLPCTCGDAGATGVALCRDDGTLGTCECGGPDGGGGRGGSGGSDSGGSGGTSGRGGDGGSDSGGSGGSSSDEDGGDTTDASEPDGGGDPAPLPTDGTQGAACESDDDCDDGLGCYDPGASGRGYCSTACELDEECEELEGAEYSCSPSEGVCEVECGGPDDDASCPDGMRCTFTGGVAGTPLAVYRCKYPGVELPDGEHGLFASCDEQAPCDDGLECHPTGGFCTLACTLITDDPCPELESESELQAVCMGMVGGGPPGGSMSTFCALDCAEDAEGCPDGMTCREQGPLRQCAYP